jgi:hypothetical protein
MVPSGKVEVVIGERFWTCLAKKATFLQKSRKIISRTCLGAMWVRKSVSRIQ